MIRSWMWLSNWLALVLSMGLVIAALSTIAAQAPRQAGLVEWRYYGADLDSTRYSAAADITRDNVSRLEVAWEWKPNEKPLPEHHQAVPANFSATPLMIDNVVYVSTSYNRVVALDAETGRELWRTIVSGRN